MKVLVAYGSRYGGTAGIAETLAEQMRRDGLEVDVRPASRAVKPDPYDAVVVGGALYRNRWHRAAAMYVRRNANALRRRPTYLFSSGPLADAFSGHNPPPVPEVRLLASRVAAREHITFNGCLPEKTRRFMDRAVASTLAGDYRDRDEERAWAHHVADQVKTATPA